MRGESFYFPSHCIALSTAMTSQPRLPVLPRGSPTTIRGLSETFSFHSSPEAFITSRLLAFQASHPSLANSRVPIRAKVLNRNVAVISSYHHVEQILRENWEDSSFSASEAYDELMAPFFPPPNLLLTDPPNHEYMKEAWKSRMLSLPKEMMSLVHDNVREYISGFRSGTIVDLYESMKELSWRIILSIFASASGKDATKLENLQEELLRGQFSLFPVSINTGLWQSPRSRGLVARKQLQVLLRARVQSGSSGCPFAAKGGAEQDDVANHLLLFTSSLAVKSLASLLTAILLNIFVYRRDNSDSHDNLASDTKNLTNNSDRADFLNSLFLETARLSLPIVGIMRRTTRDVIIFSGEEDTENTLIPKSWDVWLYFAGAARDPAAFGEIADLFRPDRYFQNSRDSHEVKQGLAFGAGAKSCLGEQLMTEVVMTVVKTCLGMGLDSSNSERKLELQGNVQDIPRGVQGWLGWQQGIKPEEWARDMKQLPAQRPSKAVMVKLIHNFEEIKAQEV